MVTVRSLKIHFVFGYDAVTVKSIYNGYTVTVTCHFFESVKTVTTVLNGYG